MRLPKNEYQEYKFVLDYSGQRYLSLVAINYKLHRSWHAHFDQTVEPVYLENNSGVKIPFHRNKGVLMNLTPTNITVALTPRAHRHAVEKLSQRAGPPMSPDVPLRHAERELTVVQAVGTCYPDDQEATIFRCDKTEFLAAYQDGTFRATIEGGEVADFVKDPHGVFWANTANGTKLILCSQRVAALLMNDMTAEEYLKDRHRDPSPCDRCGKPGAKQICGGCKVAHYCGKTCQITDRVQHQNFCKTYN